MRAYGKDWNYNVYSCRYCLYWKGRKTGCVYPSGCCCPIPQKPPVRNGVLMTYPKQETPMIPQSECDGCPYGRASPCLGCVYSVNKFTAKVMGSLGLSKECVSP